MEVRSRYVAYRFRAYPTPEQQVLLQQWQSAQRALWNLAHAQRLAWLGRPKHDRLRDRRSPSAFSQHGQLTECREAYEWLQDVPQMLQQDLLTQLARAWQRFFDHEGGRPHFKRKVRGAWAPLGVAARECKHICCERVRFPKLGDVRVRGHRPIIGRPVRVSLTCEVDQWFVSIACEVTERKPCVPCGAPVGLDLGVANVLADSDGNMMANPRHLAQVRRRLTRSQRTVARRKPKRGQPASNNYRKATRKVALR